MVALPGTAHNSTDGCYRKSHRMARAIYKQILNSAPKSLGASAVTVIVSVKINDGIIMASDSASTFATGQTYLTADKL
jgi:hypothetical protein